MVESELLIELPVDSLLPHEQTDLAHLEALLEQVRIDGLIKVPILVDRSSWVILDGHHRVQVAKRLGHKTISAIVIDYLRDPRVEVTGWDEQKIITKLDILNAARSHRLFAPRTSRHRLHCGSSNRPAVSADFGTSLD